MKAFILAAGVLVLTQAACAHPNYPATAQTGVQEKKPGPSECPLRFASENLCADYQWVSVPTEEETGTLVLKFWSALDQSAQDPKLALKILAWMPDMGHGSSPVRVTRTGAGEYRAENIFFSMRGGWQIRVQLKNAAAVVEEQITDVQF